MKKGRLLITSALLILVLASILVYSIYPKVKFNDSTKNKDTLKHIIGRTVLDSLQTIVKEKNVEFEVKLYERELNDMLYWQMEKMNSKESKLTGLHCEVEKGKLIFYIDSSFIGVPTQYILTAGISMNGDKITLKLYEVKMGSLKIPNDWVLNYIEKHFKNLKVDKKAMNVEASAALPKQLIISNLEIKETVKFKLIVSIKYKRDLINLAEYLYPKGYKEIIKDFIME